MKTLKKLLVATAVAASATSASATLNVRDFFTDAALSFDALGVDGVGSGQVQAQVASGSTVLKAYLYRSSVWNFMPVQPDGLSREPDEVARQRMAALKK